MKIVTAEQMRKIDQDSAREGLSTEILMENAGKAVAEHTADIIGEVKGKVIVFLIGPGNNGGDGLVAARYLKEWGADSYVYLCGNRPENDKNLELVHQNNILCVNAGEDASFIKLDELLARSDVLIDALFGTGNSRPIESPYRDALEKARAYKISKPQMTVIAVDIPSGLNANTGSVDIVCLPADYTITLAFPKIGIYRFPGAKVTGEVRIADIGIPFPLAALIPYELLVPKWVKTVLPGRPSDANKGTFGKVLIIGGSPNYIGALHLAAMGAARCGTGLVTVAVAGSLQPVLASQLIEPTWLPLPEAKMGILSADSALKTILQNTDGYNALLIGCGLGQGQSATRLVKALLLTIKKELPPLVIDADALNILSTTPVWWERLSFEEIVTPHPGEMARLMGTGVEEVQSNRFETARLAAAQWNKVVVLKGAFTVIASPSGKIRVSPFANPGLATAGTGDVLAGIIAGFRAQGLSAFDAASCGVYVHGLAGELTREKLGVTGCIASDLLPEIPRAINKIMNE